MIFSHNHKILCFLVVTFVMLALLVTQGWTGAVDELGVVAVRGGRSAGDTITAVIANLTHLGDSITLAVIALGTVGFLLLKGERLAAGWFMAAASGSFIITAISKWAFGRARPEVVEQFASASSASFPSGHTLRSAVVYALIAYLIARSRPSNSNVIIYCFAATIIIMNGVSRVYLGVHWPTDVLGAWLIAGFWLLLCKNGYEQSCAKRDSGTL